MTERKFLLYREQGKIKLIVRCPKCNRTVELVNPSKIVFRNLEGTLGLMMIPCLNCGEVSHVRLCLHCVDLVAKTQKWSSKQ